jgi:lipase chaperone LimK
VLAALAGGWFGLRPGPSQAAAALPVEATPRADVPPPLQQALPRAAPASAPTAGSLVGTQPDGDWALDGQGRLQPQLGLRRRFDYLLSQIGERSLPELRAQLLQLAQAELDADTTAAVLALWDRYLQLQQQPWKLAVDLQRPESWRAALAERQQQRRVLLGPAWAEAFYGDEERALLAQILALEQGRPHAPEALPPPLPQAAEREAALQAQWADWERRLAEARVALARLQQAPEYSAPQRAAAREQLLQRLFSPAERVRAEALLAPMVRAPM